MTAQHAYEVRPRKDRRGSDLISDALHRLWPTREPTRRTLFDTLESGTHESRRCGCVVIFSCIYRADRLRSVEHRRGIIHPVSRHRGAWRRARQNSNHQPESTSDESCKEITNRRARRAFARHGKPVLCAERCALYRRARMACHDGQNKARHG